MVTKQTVNSFKNIILKLFFIIYKNVSYYLYKLCTKNKSCVFKKEFLRKIKECFKMMEAS